MRYMCEVKRLDKRKEGTGAEERRETWEVKEKGKKRDERGWRNLRGLG